MSSNTEAVNQYIKINNIPVLPDPQLAAIEISKVEPLPTDTSWDIPQDQQQMKAALILQHCSILTGLPMNILIQCLTLSNNTIEKPLTITHFEACARGYNQISPESLRITVLSFIISIVYKNEKENLSVLNNNMNKKIILTKDQLRDQRERMLRDKMDQKKIRESYIENIINPARYELKHPPGMPNATILALYKKEPFQSCNWIEPRGGECDFYDEFDEHFSVIHAPQPILISDTYYDLYLKNDNWTREDSVKLLKLITECSHNFEEVKIKGEFNYTIDELKKRFSAILHLYQFSILPRMTVIKNAVHSCIRGFASQLPSLIQYEVSIAHKNQETILINFDNKLAESGQANTNSDAISFRQILLSFVISSEEIDIFLNKVKQIYEFQLKYTGPDPTFMLASQYPYILSAYCPNVHLAVFYGTDTISPLEFRTVYNPHYYPPSVRASLEESVRPRIHQVAKHVKERPVGATPRNMINRPKKYSKSGKYSSKKKKNGDSSDETSDNDDSDDENFRASGPVLTGVSRVSARLGSQVKKKYDLDDEEYDFEKEDSVVPEIVYPVIEKVLAMRQILKTDLVAELAVEKTKASNLAKQRYSELIRAKNPTPNKLAQRSSISKKFNSTLNQAESDAIINRSKKIIVRAKQIVGQIADARKADGKAPSFQLHQLLSMLPEDYQPTPSFTNAINSGFITEELVTVFSKSTQIIEFAAKQNQEVSVFFRNVLNAFQNKFNQDVIEFNNQCQAEAMKIAEQQITIEELHEKAVQESNKVTDNSVVAQQISESSEINTNNVASQIEVKNEIVAELADAKPEINDDDNNKNTLDASMCNTEVASTVVVFSDNDMSTVHSENLVPKEKITNPRICSPRNDLKSPNSPCGSLHVAAGDVDTLSVVPKAELTEPLVPADTKESFENSELSLEHNNSVDINIDIGSNENTRNGDTDAKEGVEIENKLVDTTLTSTALHKSHVIATAEDELEDDETHEIQYLIKTEGISYLHLSWLNFDDICDKFGPKAEAKVNNFLKKRETVEAENNANFNGEPFNPEFLSVDRILNAQIKNVEILIEDPNGVQTTRMVPLEHYLVKWLSLSYTQATWEIASDIQDELKISDYRRYSILSTEFELHPSNTPPKPYTASRVYKNGHGLRDYQIEGCNFMINSHHSNRNLILADEMGLGKTVQSIAFLYYCYTYLHCRGPFLIVAPLSTIGHWKRELEEWTDFNTVLYYEPTNGKAARQVIRDTEFGFGNNGYRGRPVKFNVLLTTYEVLQSDITELEGIRWKVLVIDEAHRLKNRNSKTLECLNQVVSDRRILLTGTPIQNSTGELFTLLQYTEPTVFKNSELFYQKFGDLKEASQVMDLQEIIKPYVLRRLKDAVEKSIPPKEETIIDIELTTVQKQYYRAIYERNVKFLKIGTTAANQPKLINIEMQLRKCCNHPFLIEGVEQKQLAFCPTVDSQYQTLIQSSGKMVLLDKLLPKLKREGHKVLIFSQMVRVLDILEDYIRWKGYGFERLDGSASGNTRQVAIDNFSNKPNRFVFLLSTRAGGVGLNLTAADTVIIFDSDWNPQQDIQAQARVHRIGQKNRVQIYRLLTKNTYEAQMFDRASKKLSLDQAVLSNMADQFDDSLQADIDQLLKLGAYGLLNEADESETFCEADIDVLLEKNSRVVVQKDAETKSSILGNINYSKMSFTSEQSNANLDINDPLFWEKMMKKTDTDSKAPSIQALLESLTDGSGTKSFESRAELYFRIAHFADCALTLKERSCQLEETEVLLQVLITFISLPVFSESSRNLAQEWYNGIDENRHKRRIRKKGEEEIIYSLSTYSQPRQTWTYMEDGGRISTSLGTVDEAENNKTTDSPEGPRNGKKRKVDYSSQSVDRLLQPYDGKRRGPKTKKEKEEIARQLAEEAGDEEFDEMEIDSDEEIIHRPTKKSKRASSTPKPVATPSTVKKRGGRPPGSVNKPKVVPKSVVESDDSQDDSEDDNSFVEFEDDEETARRNGNEVRALYPKNYPLYNITFKNKGKAVLISTYHDLPYKHTKSKPTTSKIKIIKVKEIVEKSPFKGSMDMKEDQEKSNNEIVDKIVGNFIESSGKTDLASSIPPPPVFPTFD